MTRAELVLVEPRYTAATRLTVSTPHGGCQGLLRPQIVAPQIRR